MTTTTTDPWTELDQALSTHLGGIEARVASGDPTARGLLAGLRDGGRRDVGDHTLTWATVVGLVPDDLAGRNGHPSPVERSVFHTVTLHALHAQGGTPAHDPRTRPGRALGRLVHLESSSTAARVHSLLGSGTTEQFVRHLTSLVTMLRRRGIGMDYRHVQRAVAGWEDPARRTRTRLAWGRDLALTKNDDDTAPTTTSEEDNA